MVEIEKIEKSSKIHHRGRSLSVGEAIEGVVYLNSLWEEIVGERKLKAFVKTNTNNCN